MKKKLGPTKIFKKYSKYIFQSAHTYFYKRKANNTSVRNMDGNKIDINCCFYKAKLNKNGMNVNVIYSKMENVKDDSDPIILLTSLEVNDDNIEEIIELFSHRWSVEVMHEYLKRSFNLEDLMVRNWESIKMMIGFILMAYVINLISYTMALKLEEKILRFGKTITVFNKRGLTLGKYIEIIENINFKSITVPIELKQIL